MPIDALKYGTIGLCAVLTYFAFRLLMREIHSATPRPAILRAVWVFMIFAVVSMLIGLASQLSVFRPEASGVKFGQVASGFGADYFNGRYRLVDAHDEDLGAFKARYSYTGELVATVEGDELVLDGDIQTLNSQLHNMGTARYTARGPIDNNQVAAYFVLRRPGVRGFGTAFMEFDSSGHATIQSVVRITRTQPGEGDVGRVTFHLERIPQ